ncbi:hypothetical protein BGY98DRAFT_1065301 [Russula aff. rugulosa BPL654]|nr:hypothetical protein BGY98DRAFT_1065301 [Russula aff. rugulosa BPL654]
MASAFFYGTLMHPKILKRVLHNDASHLKICPAILMDYTRHHVSNADYPAILPCERSKALLGRELTPEENSIRGTLVTGFTNQDFMFLDVFEGNVRTRTSTRPIDGHSSDAAVSSSAVKGSLIPTALPPLPSADELAEPIPAQTYVWCSKDSYLEKELWSFDEFVKNNAYKWIGPEAKSSEYVEVDVVKERMSGEIASGGAQP